TRQPAPNAGVLGNERLLAAIFAPESVEKKRNTEAIETGPSQLVAARVLQYRAAHTRALTEVRDDVRRLLVA
ncbi:hypothetical protein, partial [Klebsiella pneumoniae]|uniref:hypothetical protein n=1 Tax=Klebsiella pneumoniae TaxID=573 RepID=UPI0025A140AF